MTNQNTQFQSVRKVLCGAIKLCKFGFFICIEMDKSETIGVTFSIKAGLPFVCGEGR